jgi:lysozyme
MKHIKLIQKWEGCKLEAYLCSAGVATIGWGSTLYANGTKVKLGDKITQKEADDLFLITLKQYEDAVDRLVISKINSNQRSALISFCYNLGINALKNSTLLKKVNADPSNLSIKDEFMKWVKAGGKTIQGLVNRRNDEQKLYFTNGS